MKVTPWNRWVFRRTADQSNDAIDKSALSLPSSHQAVFHHLSLAFGGVWRARARPAGQSGEAANHLLEGA